MKNLRLVFLSFLLLVSTIAYAQFGSSPFGTCGSGSGVPWTPQYDAIPNIITDYPAWIAWKDKRIAQFENHCPLSRTTTYYFSKESGASDSNSCLSIFKPCLTLSKAATLIAALPSNGDARFRFRRGDTWSEATVTLNNTKQNVTFDDYGDTTLARPFFNKFTLSYSSGWTLASGNRYTRAETNDIAWVRRTLDRLGDTAGTPLIRQNSSANCEATSGSYFWGANVLHINLGGTDPNTVALEAVITNTDIGIGLGGDGSRAENIRADGYGMSRTNSATQAEGMKSTVEGTAAVYFKNVEAYYCSSHCAAHYTGGSQLGGKSMFNGVVTGLPMYNSSGETSQNTYANQGGQETWFVNGVVKYGTLPSSDWPYATTFKRSIGWYGHTAGSGITYDLIVKYNLSIPASAYSQPAVLSSQADYLTTAITSPTEARYFLVNSIYDGNSQAAGNGLDFSSQAVIYGNIFRFKVQALANNNAWAANSPKYVWLVNNYIESDLTALTTTSFTLWNAPGVAKTNNNIMYWWNNQIKFTNNSTTGAHALDGDSCNDTDNAPSPTADDRNGEFKNNILSFSTLNAAGMTCFSNYATKQMNNAYYRVTDHTGKTRGFNLDPAKQTPGSEPVLGTSQSQFLQTGTTTTYTVGYDMNGKRRTVSPPDLGPVDFSSP